MTILSVKNQLLTHFMQHDVFDFSKHSLEIKFDKEVAAFREQMVTAACEELEKLGLVRKMQDQDSLRIIWVLVQPLSAYQQQVIINPLTANMVALAVNHYNEIEQLDGRCDMSKIDELDILRLVQIIGNLEEDLEKRTSNLEKEEEDEE